MSVLEARFCRIFNLTLPLPCESVGAAFARLWSVASAMGVREKMLFLFVRAKGGREFDIG